LIVEMFTGLGFVIASLNVAVCAFLFPWT